MPKFDKNPRRNALTDALFDAILSLENREECYQFFDDLCTVKEIADMSQRLEAAKLLLAGKTYEQIVKSAEISTATISRINRCIQYGSGGYQVIIDRLAQREEEACCAARRNVPASVCPSHTLGRAFCAAGKKGKMEKLLNPRHINARRGTLCYTTYCISMLVKGGAPFATLRCHPV